MQIGRELKKLVKYDVSHFKLPNSFNQAAKKIYMDFPDKCNNFSPNAALNHSFQFLHVAEAKGAVLLAVEDNGETN